MATRGSAALSIAMSETVRGYEIKRLPLGGYLQALEAIREAPGALMAAMFPDMSAAQILAQLKTIDESGVSRLLVQAMTVAPGQMIPLLSRLTGVDEEALLSDPAIGLDGVAQMLEAFVRLNGIGNFMQAVRRLAAQIAKGKEAGSSD